MQIYCYFVYYYFIRLIFIVHIYETSTGFGFRLFSANSFQLVFV